jgi:retinol dehydrogenase-12
MARASGEPGSMAGKVCLVTGATAGIGRVTARELARRGAFVWIVGRSPERIAATLDEVRPIAEAAGGRVDALTADLAEQSEVRRLADEVNSRLPRLDVLVNNAGGMFLARETTGERLERTFALNHLAYYSLTNLVLDRLRAAPRARVVVVASDAHRSAGPLEFDDLQMSRRYGGWHAYCRSKLANVLFTRELARRLAGESITVNALHPGFVATEFFRFPGWRGGLVRGFARMTALTPEKGALTPLYLAGAPEVEGVTGRYFVKCRTVTPSPAALDDNAARRLWDASAALTDIAGPPAP